MGLRSKACELCGGMHCYWCGLPFPHVLRQETLPTREHLESRVIVTAHALCNNVRGHRLWTPFHERDVVSPEAPSQRAVREAIEAVLNGRARPRIALKGRG